MWPFTQRKKINKTPSIQSFRTDPRRNKTVVQESIPDTSTSEFVMGVAGIPVPTAAGMAGFAIHSMSESSNAKASESCTPSESSSSSSSSDSGSSYSSSSSDSSSSSSSCGGE